MLRKKGDLLPSNKESKRNDDLLPSNRELRRSGDGKSNSFSRSNADWTMNADWKRIADVKSNEDMPRSRGSFPTSNEGLNKKDARLRSE